MSPIVQIEEEINKLRRLIRLIDSPRFDLYYKMASPELKKAIDSAIESRDFNAVKRLLPDPGPVLPYEERPVSYLRVVARGLGVAYYSRMDRVQLISEIRIRERLLQNTPGDSQASRPVGGLGRVPS
jgi:hypothetical protein